MTAPIPLPAPGPISLENWGIPLTQRVNSLSQTVNYAVLRRYRRTTAMGTTTTEVGVMRIDNIPLLAGQIYRFVTGLVRLDSSVGSDEMYMALRMNAAGLATTGSSLVPASNSAYRQVDAAVAEERQINTIYVPTVDENLSLLLVCGRIAGSGNININIDATNQVCDLYIEFMGIDVGSSGTNI